MKKKQDITEQSQDKSVRQVFEVMKHDFDTFCKQAEEFIEKGKAYDGR